MTSTDTEKEYQRKLSERNSLFSVRQPIQQHPEPDRRGIMDYPVNSSSYKDPSLLTQGMNPHPSLFHNAPVGGIYSGYDVGRGQFPNYPQPPPAPIQQNNYPQSSLPLPPQFNASNVPLVPSPNGQIQRQLDEMRKTIRSQNELIKKLAPSKK